MPVHGCILIYSQGEQPTRCCFAQARDGWNVSYSITSDLLRGRLADAAIVEAQGDIALQS